MAYPEDFYLYEDLSSPQEYPIKTIKNIVVNKKDILKEIDDCLCIENPFIEYIFTMPAWYSWFREWTGSRSESSINPYGHSVFRYCVPGKVDKVLNISGSKGVNLVNRFPSDDYLFDGTHVPGNDQGGISKRSFISVRIEDLDEEVVNKLDQFFNHLEKRNIQGDAKFSILFGAYLNRFSSIERGNCAYWTSSGFKHVGLMKNTSLWPLWIFFSLAKEHLEKINIVSYQGINHFEEPEGALLYPFFWLKRSYREIWQLDRQFANVIVRPKQLDQRDEGDMIVREYELTIEEKEHINKRIEDIRKKFHKIGL